MSTGLPQILHDNRLADATPAASTTAAGYSVLNVRDWRPYTWWKPTALPATITVDCGSAKAADYAAVYGHDLGTQGATLEIRGSTDNFATSNVLVASATPTDDDPIVLTWASASYRYWRARVTGSTMPSLAIVAIGAALPLPRRLLQGFDPVGRRVQGETNRSERGHPLGRNVQFESWSQQIAVRVTWSWLRSTWLPAWKAHLRDTPFLFAWDPTDHADETRLVVAGDTFEAATEAGEAARLTLELSGVA